MLSLKEKRQLILLSAERIKRKNEKRLLSYRPYPKQLEFHNNGKHDRERLLMAGNQLGKTWSMGFEVAMHLTGRYPKANEIFYPTENELNDEFFTDDNTAEALKESLGNLGLFGADVYPNGWQGLKFTKPNWWWCASVSGEATRDNPQRILVGPPALREWWGTGAIPMQDLLIGDKGMEFAMRRGTADALDHILVKHVSGGTSICQFKTYEQGREKWQGPTLDGIWFDEEPPLDIYMEGLTRTNKTSGPVALTFTPLLGMSEVVRLFISDEKDIG